VCSVLLYIKLKYSTCKLPRVRINFPMKVIKCFVSEYVVCIDGDRGYGNNGPGKNNPVKKII